MKRAFFFLAAFLLGLSVYAQEEPVRPRIYGIGWVRLRVTNLERSKHFYEDILQLKEFPNKCFTPSSVCMWINANEKLELVPTFSHDDKGGLDLIGFSTPDLKKMARYLYSRGLKPSKIMGSGRQYFQLQDLEGHLFAFESTFEDVDFIFSPVSSKMLHAGFVVHDALREDKLFMDILNFRLYWYGGFKDQDTDWYEIQVPDGHNWIEYMLNIPASADHAELGVQNHFSLGVKDIHATADQLHKNGLQKFDGPEIGRDGKWSLDAYDPDGTRIEFMEFAPAQKPCCHPYTAEHPKP